MEKSTLIIDGPINSSNPGEQFLRITENVETNSPFLEKRTGFYPIKEGGYDEAIKWLADNKKTFKIGQRLRSGAFNVTMVDADVQAEVSEGVEKETLLAHKA
jgi:hypothetical protein